MAANVFTVSVDPMVPYGSRIPGVWVYNFDQNDQNNLDLIHQDGSSDSFKQLVYQDASITDTAFNLKMSEFNGKFEIRINDELVLSEDQGTPTTFENVYATMGFLYPGSTVPSGWYKNFKLWTRC